MPKKRPQKQNPENKIKGYTIIATATIIAALIGALPRVMEWMCVMMMGYQV